VAGHLWENEALQQVQLEPPVGMQVVMPASPSPIGAVLVQTWNQYGGLLGALCDVVGVDHGSMLATLQVESGGRGSGPDGRMTIRFENHLFARFLANDDLFNRHFFFEPSVPWTRHFFRRDEAAEWQPCHTSQASEWDVLDFARSLADEPALSSMSMGVARVMGFNAGGIGYPSVTEMFNRFSSDIRYQILGMFDYIRGAGPTSPMIDALRAGNYEGFAFGYNGPGQAPVYGGLIRNAVLAFQQLQGAPTGNAGAANSVGGSVVTTVQPGDSLGRIAARFGVTMQALAAENGIANPDLIRVGQVLRIPGQAPAPASTPTASPQPVTTDSAVPAAGTATATAEERLHVVQAGEMLSAIAGRFGVSVEAIVATNGIANPDLIQVGQVLRIPAPATREMRQPPPSAPAVSRPPGIPREIVRPRGAFEPYVVVPGDTLESIAAALKTSAEAINASNQVLLLPGQVLGIPR
jgi:LysM repeat protein